MNTTIIITAITLTIVLGLANLTYDNVYLYNGFITLLAITIAYLLFKTIERLFIRRIKNIRAQSSFKRILLLLELLASIIIISSVWVPDTQALTVAYGLVGAGIAVTLQDFFKSFIGGLLIFINGIYRVSDRVEIDGRIGDVLEIGILYTTILEMRNWMGKEETGRITTIPNSYVLSKPINNYTKEHRFIWDEIIIPITYDSDWKTAYNDIIKVVKRETKDLIKEAEMDLDRIHKKHYHIYQRSTEPTILVTLTDNWIEFKLRFISKAQGRRSMRDIISRAILEEVIEKNKKIKIATQTMEVGLKKKA